MSNICTIINPETGNVVTTGVILSHTERAEIKVKGLNSFLEALSPLERVGIRVGKYPEIMYGFIYSSIVEKETIIVGFYREYDKDGRRSIRIDINENTLIDIGKDLSIHRVCSLVLDVSDHGLCFKTKHKLAEGDPVVYYYSGGLKPTTVQGEVVWVKPLDGEFQYGVKFIKFQHDL